MISCKCFEHNQMVWLFDSKLKLFFGKLRSKWDGSLVVQQAFPYAAIKILDPQDDRILTVKNQCLKPIMTNEIELGIIESINLVDSVYYDY